MNFTRRIVTFFQMFTHQIAVMKEGEFHVEELHVEGPEIAGVFIGVKFVSRHCQTCGYLKPPNNDPIGAEFLTFDEETR